MKIRLLFTAVVLLAFILRFYQLGSFPPALYWDEASLGYNAYAMATTLHDEHGVFLPVSNFAAFGDYKPPVYIYSTALAVKAFGLSEYSVRMTSALAGILIVAVTFFLVVELGFSKKISLLSSLVIAISPWSLQMSRAAFEANLATSLTGLGVWLLIRGLRKGTYSNFVFGAFALVLAMYTFNSHRIFVPMITLTILAINWRDSLRLWKKILIFGTVCLLLILPAVSHLTSPEGRLRFNEVTWLNNLSIVETSNRLIAENNGAIWAKIVYNRRIFYGQIFLEHYLDHFRSDFLFVHGDVNPRLSIQTVGELYWWDLPFLLVGIIWLLRKRDRSAAVIFSWILLAPIPAALARETPHALRTLNILPMPQVAVGLGVGLFFNYLKSFKPHWLLVVGVVLAFVIFVFRYLESYYLVYPIKYSGAWQYGYKQLVKDVKIRQDGYDYVSVTGRLGRPYIYFLFYNQYPVDKYLKNQDANRDQFGFWTVRGFDKYAFDRTPPNGNILFIRTPSETPNGTKILETIYDPSSQAIFNLY